ncbi:hypothetical protein TVAG_498200 [Trichomonas vaginalis G3]|uniref:receptor protein-tyrosine kinase n=1 Tax=Trichomonas vaginalis (strain ATCC PRA-98 / G3) TaxID=412133 RepID=A2FLF0_TRIV3|nr:glycine-rich protein family [Trichomonas vaginalis G3]EAX94266.1 hypothetical protein TVAG_498200 [Trichomonas vaginalis G3]KAI5505034.1 glycine-rich protein family [Trichomonas vaginalis G3]|eukprot:XP_001307196.1 hypothetical protein [Trichomonas vaginalis G3]
MLLTKSIGNLNIKVSKNTYEFYYPCEDPSECTDYVVDIPAGRYKVESYGASGGYSDDHISAFQDPSNNNKCSEDIVLQFKGNAKCRKYASMGGSGGYVSGILSLTNTTCAYIMIGGHGQYVTPTSVVEDPYLKENMIPGGYGGGGFAIRYYSLNAPGSASGGSRTALMINEDDIFHSILVAGAGSGTDNAGGFYRKEMMEAVVVAVI